MLLCCAVFLPQSRAVKETTRRRRRSACYLLMSTLFALFVGCVAVPVAADAPARAHCSHWWCCSSTCCCCWCCGLPYAQLFYLLVLVLLLVAAVAPEGTTSAHAATLFAGGLPLLLQCLPGFLLPLLCRCSSPTSDSKIQSDNKQRTGRRAVRQGNESAADIGDYQPRAARSSAISGLTRPIFLTKSSEFGPRTSLGKADGPRTRTNPAAFDCRCEREEGDPVFLGLAACMPL